MAFRGQAAFTATGAPQVWYWHDDSPAVTQRGKYGPDTVVQVDGNGDGIAEGGVRVQHAVLNGDDFLI